MATLSGECPVEATVERGDGLVEHPSGGVEVHRTQGVRIPRESGPGEPQPVGRRGQAGGKTSRVERFKGGTVEGGAVVGPSRGAGTGVGPVVSQGEQLGELGPGRGVEVQSRRGFLGGDGRQKGPGLGSRQRMVGVGDQMNKFGATEFDGGLVDQGVGGLEVEQERGPGQPAGFTLGSRGAGGGSGCGARGRPDRGSGTG